MPDSMYDKLGELLSKALESGDFFTSEDKGKDLSSIKKDTVGKKTEEKEKDTNTSSDFNQKTVYKNSHIKNDSKNHIVSGNKKLIKYAHSKIKNACTLVGVNEGMDYEEAKRAYHKKLLRFHPDKNADNLVMNKITREKTDAILKAWKIIEDWYLS